jgi:hypothetical protein
MPEGQSLYAPYVDPSPDALDQQGFASAVVDVEGTDVLVAATAKNLATTFLITRYPTLQQSGGQAYFTYTTTSAPSFSYTSTITTGTISFQFLIGGAVIQSITSTPSASPQTITFNPYINIPVGSSNGTTTTQIIIQATATDAQTITETSITPLWVMGLRCVS